jgi:protein SCO1/2
MPWRESPICCKMVNLQNLYDMVHTENFVLVDTKKESSWFYDGTKKEDIKRLIEDINFLTKE